MSENPETTIVIGAGSALLISLTAVLLVMVLIAALFFGLEELKQEWHADRATALVVAQYQREAAEAQADAFNANPIPGELQCRPQAVYADMVVQR